MSSPTTQPADRPGRGQECPHCGATSGVVEKNDEPLCIVCGGPRIVVDAAVGRPGGEAELLRQVNHLRMRRAAWTVGGAVVGAVGLFALLVVAILLWATDPGTLGALVLVAAAAVPLVIASVVLRKARALSSHARELWQRAWRRAAMEVVAALGGEPDPAEVARALRVSEDRALDLVAEAQVEGLLEGPAQPPRLRVSEADEPSATSARPERARNRSRGGG